MFNYAEEDCGSTCSFLLRLSFVCARPPRSWQDTAPVSVWPLGRVCGGAFPLQCNRYIQALISLWAIFARGDSVMLAQQPGLG